MRSLIGVMTLGAIAAADVRHEPVTYRLKDGGANHAPTDLPSCGQGELLASMKTIVATFGDARAVVNGVPWNVEDLCPSAYSATRPYLRGALRLIVQKKADTGAQAFGVLNYSESNADGKPICVDSRNFDGPRY